MSKLIRPAICALALALFASAGASAWEIPLTVENPTRTGVPPFISGGVPLLAGQAKAAGDLRLAVKDAGGKLTAIPAQFRILARWLRTDNSIRWVLVDFASANVPGEKKVVYLTDAKLDVPAPKDALTVEDKDDAITVSTGPAKFTISKKKFNFIDHAVVDGEEVLESSADLGTVIEDTFGEKYYGSEGVKEVKVLESGPSRVCVRVRGQHLARGGKGYSRGMYGYDIFMNFYAGSTDVSADVIVTNNFAKSIGEPVMKDASLLIRLAGGGGGCKVYGAAPLDGRLGEGKSVCLYQDSNGAETWQECQGYTAEGGRPGGAAFNGKTVSFRGYRIVRRGGEKEEILGGGDHARGVMHISNGKVGAIILTRNFWQQFPKAVEAFGDGTLRLGMFPRESLVPHYLDDAAAKGYEVVLHFYVKGKSRYSADPNGRTWGHVFADTWDIPAFPRPPLAHIAATGALTDLGPFTPPVTGFTDYDTAVNLRRLMMTDEYWGNSLGWQVFGERWKSHGGHSTRGARQPIQEDDFLYRWLVTGGPGWLDVGINRSRQFRDVRAYRIDDTDVLAFKDWGEFRKANTAEGRESANRPIPNDEELKKYQAGLVRHARWEFPNPEHCTLDQLYNRYVLFGDVRAYENMRVVAGHGGFFALGTAPKPTAKEAKDVGGSLGRSQGWSWRALERYWELTGDKRAEELLRAVIKAYEPLIGKSPLWFANNPNDQASPWFTQILSRAAAMTALDTGDAKALEICKSLAVGKDQWDAKPDPAGLAGNRANGADYFCTLFAVLYHLTGEAKYKDEVMKRTNNGQRLLDVSDVDNYEHAARTYPANAHWLLNQPPAKR